MKAGSTSGDAPRPSEAGGGFVRTLLRVPLFYKILIANAVILALVTIGSAFIAHAAADNENISFALLLGTGVVLSVISNAIILRVALSPVKQLEGTARRVQDGDLTARVEVSDLADRDLERLAGTFNMMLDSADAYRTRLREVAARALTAQEEERRRIAQELHDGIAQTLTALRVRLRVARATQGEDRTEALDRISTDIGAATEEIRRIAQGLRPPALDMLGLSPAIESYARNVADTTGMTIVTDIAATDGVLSPDAELAVYRIVQEALSNVARHSTASSARVDLEVTRNTVQVVVSDTGRGFSVAEEMSRGGLGLFGMQERGAYLGGTVEIESNPGAGTRIRVTIPTVETARYA
ncbi:MAG TPA: sensor histidine kinase [Longimicrobiales bacterium]|nr:sensor histidine kinase [Longimicrobiales bacterium]